MASMAHRTQALSSIPLHLQRPTVHPHLELMVGRQLISEVLRLTLCLPSTPCSRLRHRQHQYQHQHRHQPRSQRYNSQWRNNQRHSTNHEHRCLRSKHLRWCPLSNHQSHRQYWTRQRAKRRCQRRQIVVLPCCPLSLEEWVSLHLRRVAQLFYSNSCSFGIYHRRTHLKELVLMMMFRLANLLYHQVNIVTM